MNKRSVAQKLALLEEYKSMSPISQREAAKRLKISRGFLQNLLKSEADLRNPDGASTGKYIPLKKDKKIDIGAKRTRRDRTIAEKLALLDEYHSAPLLKYLSQRQAAARLNISRGLLQSLLKNEAFIRSQAFAPTAERKRFDQALGDWLKFAEEQKLPTNVPILKNKAEEIAQAFGHFEFKATDDWYSQWKIRHGSGNSMKGS